MKKYYITVDLHTPGNKKEKFINESIATYNGMLVQCNDPLKVIRKEVNNIIENANSKFRSRIVISSMHKYQHIESIFINYGNYSSIVRMHEVISDYDLTELEKVGE